MTGQPMQAEESAPVSIEPLEPEGPNLPARPDTTASSKSPFGAFIRSAVLPGWGQFYTDHPVRGALIFSAQGVLLTLAWIADQRANQSWDLYQWTAEPRYLEEYDRRFNRGRDLLSVAVSVYLYNLADAYVSAHLYDFQGKISLDGGVEGVNLSMNWAFP